MYTDDFFPFCSLWGGFYHSGWGCELCGGDGPVDDYVCEWYYGGDCDFVASAGDNLERRKPHKKKPVDKLWEKVFAKSIKAGPYPVFHDAKDCDIEVVWLRNHDNKVAATTPLLRGVAQA